MNKSKYMIELFEFGIPREVRRQVQQQVQFERAKFRHAQTGPSLSHALKIIRELDGVTGYRPDQNVIQRPTVGMDAEYDRYDPDPSTRWNPELRQQVEANKKATKAGRLLKSKSGLVLDPKTGAPIDPETGEVIGNEQDEVPNQQQDPNQDPNQDQQDPAQAQQGNDPQAQQDLDPNAGQQQTQPTLPDTPPEKPELPGDQRKDPMWKGNQAAKKPDNVSNSSQKVVSRYDKGSDPMRKQVIPTSSYLLRQNRRNPQSHAKGTGLRNGGPSKYWS